MAHPNSIAFLIDQLLLSRRANIPPENQGRSIEYAFVLGVLEHSCKSLDETARQKIADDLNLVLKDFQKTVDE